MRHEGKLDQPHPSALRGYGRCRRRRAAQRRLGADDAPNATVGPGFTISLRTPTGANVTHLPVGTYEITVRDQAIEHNFHLTGPGVDMRTEVEEVATVTWTVTFSDGRYTFQCDPHANTMNGRFTVGNAPCRRRRRHLRRRPPSRRASRTSPRPSGRGPRSRSNSEGSGHVKRLKAGALPDRRARPLAHAQLPPDRAGVNKKTTVASHGIATWTVTFRKGDATATSATRTRAG